VKEVTTTVPGNDVAVPTNEELWEAFKPYYQEYYGLTRADQPITAVSTFAPAKMCEIMTKDDSEYKWLGDYITEVSADQGYTLTNDPAADGMEALWRWSVHSFFNCEQRTSWPKTADFSTAGKPEAWGGAYQKAHGGTQTETKTEYVEVELPSKITAAYTIPTPVKDGDTFVGWYDNNDGTGVALTVLPVGYDGTVYAIWKSNVSTDVEQVARPKLDINAPMYDIMGRLVDTSYRGIIIQNGHKYLLR
jgi:uncharacterized repeat protein (TIGR02543 family)